ncbi:hypothetical protein X729_10245 [Mesorhizobium sp. L103C131B0]|nr:hypothetical protein X729_10245 [Mesorhizobium sp. L103C131B0]
MLLMSSVGLPSIIPYLVGAGSDPLFGVRFTPGRSIFVSHFYLHSLRTPNLDRASRFPCRRLQFRDGCLRQNRRTLQANSGAGAGSTRKWQKQEGSAEVRAGDAGLLKGCLSSTLATAWKLGAYPAKALVLTRSTELPPKITVLSHDSQRKEMQDV